jgi:hypothetical protein
MNEHEMFQFSKFVRDVADLKDWNQWFSDRGIYTEYRQHVVNFGGTPIMFYALWREGKEAKDNGAEYLYAFES